jgi:GNAT superfamily N-acetyltransferase
MLTITLLELEDAAALSSAFQQIGWNKPVALFERYYGEQVAGERYSFVAKLPNEIVGYVTVLWISDHPFFHERNIPEIKDLNVLPQHSRNGFGRMLLEHAEKQIASRFPVAGLGVGLTQDYGPAQVLYVKQGYIPTGEGITHHQQPIHYGSHITVDDDTVLWFTKRVGVYAD